MEETLTEAIRIIIQEALKSNSSSASSENRIPPLAIFRMARGGKSKILEEIFKKLKKIGYLPIFITFNFDFLQIEGESQKNAVMRLIAKQFIDPSVNLEKNFLIDEERLLRHIDDTSVGKTVVLLVDELNLLSQGKPLDKEAAIFLTKNFSDQKNRYLVFSSHIRMNFDEVMQAGAVFCSPSLRLVKTLHHLPRAHDILQLAKMSAKCSSLTIYEMQFYGGIPSLIYSFKEHGLDFKVLLMQQIKKCHLKMKIICYENSLQSF
jgi:hypothetical protein